MIIMRGSIHISERKKNEYKTKQISGREIRGCRNFHSLLRSHYLGRHVHATNFHDVINSVVTTDHRVFPISRGFYL